MIKTEYIKLMHQEIDHSISRENKNKLKAYLTKNQEAEKLYKELSHSSKLLEYIPAVDPPADLIKRIINSLDFKLYPKKVKAYSNPIKIIDWFLKPTPKPAYAFALGLIMGLIVYALVIMLIFKEQPIDFTDVYGTISSIENNWIDNISTNPIDLPDMQGNIILNRHKNAILFEINIKPLQKFNLKMEFDPDCFDFSAYHPLYPAHTVFESRQNMIKVSGSQNIACILLLEKIQEKASPIEFSIEMAGKTRYHHNFLIKK